MITRLVQSWLRRMRATPTVPSGADVLRAEDDVVATRTTDAILDDLRQHDEAVAMAPRPATSREAPIEYERALRARWLAASQALAERGDTLEVFDAAIQRLGPMHELGGNRVRPDAWAAAIAAIAKAASFHRAYPGRIESAADALARTLEVRPRQAPVAVAQRGAELAATLYRSHPTLDGVARASFTAMAAALRQGPNRARRSTLRALVSGRERGTAAWTGDDAATLLARHDVISLLAAREDNETGDWSAAEMLRVLDEFTEHAAQLHPGDGLVRSKAAMRELMRHSPARTAFLLADGVEQLRVLAANTPGAHTACRHLLRALGGTLEDAPHSTHVAVLDSDRDLHPLHALLTEHRSRFVTDRDAADHSPVETAITERRGPAIALLAAAGLPMPRLDGDSPLSGRVTEGRALRAAAKTALAQLIGDTTGLDRDTSSIVAELAGMTPYLDIAQVQHSR